MSANIDSAIIKKDLGSIKTAVTSSKNVQGLSPFVKSVVQNSTWSEDLNILGNLPVEFFADTKKMTASQPGYNLNQLTERELDFINRIDDKNWSKVAQYKKDIPSLLKVEKSKLNDPFQLDLMIKAGNRVIENNTDEFKTAPDRANLSTLTDQVEAIADNEYQAAAEMKTIKARLPTWTESGKSYVPTLSQYMDKLKRVSVGAQSEKQGFVDQIKDYTTVQIPRMEQELKEKDKQLNSKDDLLTAQQNDITKKDLEITERDKQIKKLDLKCKFLIGKRKELQALIDSTGTGTDGKATAKDLLEYENLKKELVTVNTKLKTLEDQILKIETTVTDPNADTVEKKVDLLLANNDLVSQLVQKISDMKQKTATDKSATSPVPDVSEAELNESVQELCDIKIKFQGSSSDDLMDILTYTNERMDDLAKAQKNWQKEVDAGLKNLNILGVLSDAEFKKIGDAKIAQAGKKEEELRKFYQAEAWPLLKKLTTEKTEEALAYKKRIEDLIEFNFREKLAALKVTGETDLQCIDKHIERIRGRSMMGRDLMEWAAGHTIDLTAPNGEISLDSMYANIANQVNTDFKEVYALLNKSGKKLNTIPGSTDEFTKFDDPTCLADMEKDLDNLVDVHLKHYEVLCKIGNEFGVNDKIGGATQDILTEVQEHIKSYKELEDFYKALTSDIAIKDKIKDTSNIQQSRDNAINEIKNLSTLVKATKTPDPADPKILVIQLKDELQRKDEKLADLVTASDEIKAKLDAANDVVETLTGEKALLTEELKTATEEAVADAASSVGEINSRDDQIAALNTDLTALKAMYQPIEENLDELILKFNVTTLGASPNMKDKIQELYARLDDIDITGGTGALNSQINSLNKQILAKDKQIVADAAVIKKQTTDIAAKDNSIKTLTAKINLLTASQKTLNDTNKSLNKTLSTSKAKENEHINALKNAECTTSKDLETFINKHKSCSTFGGKLQSKAGAASFIGGATLGSIVAVVVQKVYGSSAGDKRPCATQTQKRPQVAKAA